MRYAAHVSPETQVLTLPEPFELECGARLPGVEVAARTWGRLAAGGDNAVLICHALTGSADADRWWAPLLGPGRALDTDHELVICSNVLGSCYGTTGPTSQRPGSRRSWGPDFPPVTVRDMVRVQARLLDALGVRRLRLVIGGSLGGMQVLEWAATFPERIDAIVPIAAPGRHSAWAIGLSEAQRAAIETDPLWEEGRYRATAPPASGLAAARMVAMCTYRSWESFGQRFGRRQQGDHFAVADYLRHHGDTLVDRFDANSYITLTRAMDSHDLARGRGDYRQVLGAIRTPALVVGIDSDALYPPEEQWELAELLPRAQLAWLHSPHGHDAFLIEMDTLAARVRDFRSGLPPTAPVEGPRWSVKGRRSKVEGPPWDVESRRSKVEGPRWSVKGRRSKVKGPGRSVEGPPWDVESRRSKVEGPGRSVEGSPWDVEGPAAKVEGQRSKVEGPRWSVKGQRSKVEGPGRSVEGPPWDVEGPAATVEGRRSKVEGPEPELEGSPGQPTDATVSPGDTSTVLPDLRHSTFDLQQSAADLRQSAADLRPTEGGWTPCAS